MAVPAERLNSQATNREVGFFISETAKLTNTYTYGTILHPFMWIEGYFDPTVLTDAEIAVWDGKSYYDSPTNTIPLVNPVCFSYRGQPKNVRGVTIVSTGKDYLGNVITSAVIDGGSTGFQKLIVGGGARPAA